MITPTIGRRVWYWPSKDDKDVMSVYEADATGTVQACDAGVVFVWSDRLVNLAIADHNGNAHKRSSVQLLQDDDPVPENDGYAQWMPYQAKAAEKPAF